MNEYQEISFDDDLKIETAIMYNDTDLPLQQVLTATRTDRLELIPILIQVHWWTWVVICKKADFKLAIMLSDSKSLARLILTKFWNIVGAWFSESTLSLAAELKFNENTKKYW